MNKGYTRLLISNFILLLIIILNNVFNFFNSYTLILFLFLFALFIYKYIGYEKNSKRYQKDIIYKILIYGIIYYIFIYVLGLYIGFTKTGYSLKLLSIINHIIPLLLTIPLIELIRYIFITKSSSYKSILLLVIVNMIMLDITLLINSYSYSFLYFALLVLTPSIARNILLSYITYKVGYKPSIAYRMLFEIPVYILPLFPLFGLYIESLLQFIFPFILILLINHDFLKSKNEEIAIRKKTGIVKKVFTVSICLLLIIMILLTSGTIKYFAVTIGSNSMVPTINKGDIVIVEKLNVSEINNLSKNEILVFKHDDIIMIHRIVKIIEVNEEKYFYTKGDNNDTEDGYPISSSQVVGTYLIKIPYLGYPTVEINEKINELKQ